MTRADLLALTPQALASLGNAGLVKRAQREFAGQDAPRLEEAADGTVTGRFRDGVVTTLPPHTTLAKTTCSCGAQTVCRHRIGVVLAYAERAPSSDAAPAEPSAAPAAWSPAQIDDATLEKVLGARLVERAARLRRGLLVRVEPGPPPCAKLPTCTVRFLVPGDVAYAQCDCAAVGGTCEHLALAVWAFRAAAERPAGEVFELSPVQDPSAAAAASDGDALRAVAALIDEVLAHGIERAPPAAGRLAALRHGLAAVGATWLHDAVADLERAWEGYHARSARHGAGEITALLAELGARLRGAEHGRLPRRYVLGQDTAPQTKLDHLRLVALGARVDADDTARTVSVLFAEPGSGEVLVLRKPCEGNGEALAKRRVGGFALGALAESQLVSKAVTRHANGVIELGSRAGQSSLSGPTGEFAGLPEPLLVRDLRGHAMRCAQRPPLALRARLQTHDVHVVAVDAVLRTGYDAAQQTLWAELRTPCGSSLFLHQDHLRATPHALDALSLALRGPLTHVAGVLTRHADAWSLAPTALLGQGVVVPALAPPPAAAASLPQRAPYPRHDPLAEQLRGCQSFLADLCCHGTASPSALARGAALRRQLDDHGFAALAVRLAALLDALRARSGVSAAWLDFAVRLALCAEADVDG